MDHLADILPIRKPAVALEAGPPVDHHVRDGAGEPARSATSCFVLHHPDYLQTKARGGGTQDAQRDKNAKKVWKLPGLTGIRKYGGGVGEGEGEGGRGGTRLTSRTRSRKRKRRRTPPRGE